MGIRGAQVARINNWGRTARAAEQRGDAPRAARAKTKMREARNNATAEERQAADEIGL